MTITMTVRAINGSVVYDIDGNRIPADQFVSVPISPGVVDAVKAKDLEEVEEKDLPHRVMEDIERAKREREKPAQARPRKHSSHHGDSAIGS